MWEQYYATNLWVRIGEVAVSRSYQFTYAGTLAEHDGNIPAIEVTQRPTYIRFDLKRRSPMLKKMLSGLTPMIALLAIFFAASSRPAAATGCSNQTLIGNYGFTANGVLIGIPGVPAEVQFRSVGTARFDGKGNMTWMEHTVIGGVSLEAGWTPAKGAYHVNSNCTGLLVVNTPNSPVPLRLFLTIVKQGNQFHTVLENNAIVSEFTKVDE
jgi:hypothetical protein